MHLFVEPMDAVVVAVSPDGRVKLANEDWCVPTLQEKRAIIFSARQELEELAELVELLQGP